MNSLQNKLVDYIAITYNNNQKLDNISFPPQGMSSSVFFININNIEYAVKYGKDAIKDVPAIELIKNKKIDFPVPEVFTHFVFEDTPVLILKKIDSPLLDSVEISEVYKYIPSMVKVMQILHKVKDDRPYILSGNKELPTWKDYVSRIFDGRSIDWDEVMERECLDKILLKSSINNILDKIKKMDLELEEYSLLHTDFNQRNLFVDIGKYEINGVIDWEDAVFGDPLYDFARIRMFIWHFNLSDKIVDDYYKQVDFSQEDKKKEELYWLVRVIQYLAWYSEEEMNLTLAEYSYTKIF